MLASSELATNAQAVSAGLCRSGTLNSHKQ
jgi:hypothetical protein